jgi:hypothetical protein
MLLLPNDEGGIFSDDEDPSPVSSSKPANESDGNLPKTGSRSYTREGRPPSMFKITEQVVKLQKFLSNSAVQNYIHNRLKKHNLIQQYLKFNVLSSIYALRNLDDNEKAKMFELLTIFSFSDELIKNINLSSWKDYINTILSLDETQLDSHAEIISLYLLENHVFYFYSLDALPKWT